MKVDIIHQESILYSEDFRQLGGGSIRCVTEQTYLNEIPKANARDQYDVIIHWRKWFPDLYDPFCKNLIISQDHSYSDDWCNQVRAAFFDGQLDGILVFPTWHKENTYRELGGSVPHNRLYDGLTLGVDTETYQPIGKDPKHLLWASDPGRGLENLINPFLRLWSKDRAYRLTVTYPDYVHPHSVAKFSSFLNHPGVTHRAGLRNGPELWELFNSAGVLPYSSNFPEPSSRCHRQAMAAGCMVLYPPNMGSPSELIEDGMTGIIADPILWPDVIHRRICDGTWEDLGKNARTFAKSEDWSVQAKRFYRFITEAR